jgi:hypothetical protein
LDNEPTTHDRTPKAPEDVLAVSESTPPAPPIGPAKDVIPDPAFQKLAISAPKNDEGQPKTEKPKEPLQVRIISGDELTSFERKTVSFGWYGLLIAGASFIAALIAALVFFSQLKEMSKQTDLLGITAEQARTDAKNSAVATAKQSSINNLNN